MNDAATAKMLGVALSIGHIVSVRQEDVANPAQRLQLLHQRRDELGRVDQPVASGVPNEVAVAAIRLGGVVAAVLDRLFKEEREVPHDRFRVVVTKAADRPGGAGQQGLQRLPPVGAGNRLGFDEGSFAGFTKDRKSDLPTGIAVDAGRIHEEIARDVFRHSFFGVGHYQASLTVSLVLFYILTIAESTHNDMESSFQTQVVMWFRDVARTNLSHFQEKVFGNSRQGANGMIFASWLVLCCNGLVYMMLRYGILSLAPIGAIVPPTMAGMAPLFV